MDEVEFRQLLLRWGACQDALKWSIGKNLREAWMDCERPDWMFWLLNRMAGQEGWPTEDDTLTAFAKHLDWLYVDRMNDAPLEDWVLLAFSMWPTKPKHIKLFAGQIKLAIGPDVPHNTKRVALVNTVSQRFFCMSKDLKGRTLNMLKRELAFPLLKG